MTVPANGSTVKHVPDAVTSPPPGWRTKPYNGTVSGLSFVITYTLDGTETTREYDSASGGTWERDVGPGSVWRRVYVEANPPTVPPSGGYTVSEWTGEWTQRETGTWGPP